MNEEEQYTNPDLPGYDYGTPRSARSPFSEDDLRKLEQTAGWSEEDREILHRHREVFWRKAEQMVDSWRSVIAAQAHLSQVFLGPDGKSDDEYKARVKPRFVQWVNDVVSRPHDRDWLDYQEEIGLRHTPAKKNLTDNRQTAPLAPLRFLLAFLPVMFPIRKFFADAIESEAELDRLEAAWMKAVVLHVTLWTRTYAKEGYW